mgnify:FL=1
MGAPQGHPYACPTGACINGLGALPSPYGPTLRGAHNALRASKIKRYVGKEADPSHNLGQNIRTKRSESAAMCRDLVVWVYV